MINYDIEFIASELLLTTSELREVLDFYFEEATDRLPECHELINNQNYVELAEIMHALKGSSVNLRMDNISNLAATLERQAKLESSENLDVILGKIQIEIWALKEHIDAYYAKIIQ